MLKEIAPEVFSKYVDLYAANGGNVLFMEDLLVRAGLYGRAIQIAFGATRGLGIPKGGGLLIDSSCFEKPDVLETDVGWVIPLIER